MKSFFQLLKPAPHLPEIQDKEKVDSLYKYWRLRTLYSMFIGYSLFYFTRKSFVYAMPGMIDDLGFGLDKLGMLTSIFAIFYGLSKFASGIISDRSNPRYFMAFGLMITGVLNICFGFSSSLLAFAFIWGLNGWFQGFGWPPCARLLTHWYSQSERGSWWSTWSISHNVGAFIIPWVAGASLYYFGWRYALYIPGIICILGGLFLINRLRDTPQSLGLPSVESYRDDYTGVSQEVKKKGERELTAKETLFKYVLTNRYIWILALSYFFVYLVRTGVNDWTALFLRETRGYSVIGANGTASMFEIGGFIGSLSAGWLSDKVFGARRGPVNTLYAISLTCSLLLFWFLPGGYPYLDSASIALMGFSIFGPQVLIGISAAELSHKKAAATSTGFVGWFAYLGAAVAGYPLGQVAEKFGWNGFFLALMACSVVSILLLLPMWSVTHYRGNEHSADVEYA